MIGSSMNKYLDQQCVLTHNLNYLSYFYYFHPLHITTFKELFYRVLSGDINLVDGIINSFARTLESSSNSYIIHQLKSIRTYIVNLQNIKNNVKILKSLLNHIETVFGNKHYYKHIIIMIITNLESSIESVVRVFLECSNTSSVCILYKMIRSTTKDIEVIPDTYTRTSLTTQSISLIRLFLLQYLWIIMSHIALMEHKLLVTNLYQLIEMVIIMVDNIHWVDYCPCVTQFKFKTTKNLYITKPYELSIINPPDLKLYIHSNFSKYHTIDNEGNHLCVCLIIKHILYPSVMKSVFYLVDIDLDLVGNISRNFDKYTGSYSFRTNIFSLVFYVIEILYKIVNWMKHKYEFDKYWRSYYLCKYSDDPYYLYFISMIIYVCTLVQNILSLDNQMISNSLQNLTILILDFYGDFCDTNELTIISHLNEESEHQDFTINLSSFETIITITNQSVTLTLGAGSEDLTIGSNLIKPFRSFKSLISILHIEGPKFNIFYQSFFGLSYSLITNEYISKGTKNSFTEINNFISQKYLLKLGDCNTQLESLCETKDTNQCDKSCKSIIINACINLAREKFKLISCQVSNTGILVFFVGYEKEFGVNQVRNVINTLMSYNYNKLRNTKNNRMSDHSHQLGYYNNNNNNDSQNNLNLNPKYYTYDDIYRHVGMVLMVGSMCHNPTYIKSK